MSNKYVFRIKVLYKNHRKLLNIVFAVVGVYALLNCIGFFYSPLSTETLLRKENADALKRYTQSFGLAAPVVFVVVQALQVIIIPIPGLVIAFIAGFVFGWRPGVIYTMIGLTFGMTVVFNLSRRLGRGFVERLHGTSAVGDFEKLFLNDENQPGGLYEKSKEAIRSHGLLTFFLIMLLPGFPDNLACLVAGLTRIPIRKLLLAAIVGRFPSMLVLCLLGDGWSSAQGHLTLFILTAIALVLTATYLWNKRRIERLVIQLLVKRQTSGL